MAVGGGAVRALFVAAFVCWYSTGVFRAMDSHFGNHFGQFLRKQIRGNEHMRRDLEADRRAMERVLRAKGKELPAVESAHSLLEGLLQRIRGADHAPRPQPQPAPAGDDRESCPANPLLASLGAGQRGLLVPLGDACAARDDDGDVEDSCPARGALACEAGPPPAA